MPALHSRLASALALVGAGALAGARALGPGFGLGLRAASSAVAFVCGECGHDTAKWAGKCPACGEYNTLKEFREAGRGPVRTASGTPAAAAAARSTRSWLAPAAGAAGASRLEPLLGPAAASAASVAADERLLFRSGELDRLFGGGGIMRGSVTLIAGSPGVGKSTLLMQMAALLCRGSRGERPYSLFFAGAGVGGGSGGSGKGSPSGGPPVTVAYVSGEEASSQLRQRARRLGIDAPGLLALHEARVESILAQLDTSSTPLAAVVVDSVQTLFTDASASAAGSVSQVRESAVRLLQFAKASGVPVLLAGHVTKGGDIAGPRTLEHLVDTVLVMEAEGEAGGALGGSDAAASASASSASVFHSHRLVRCTKNRFGSANEVGLFEITSEGFVESSAQRLFLSAALAPASMARSEREQERRPSGCAVAVTAEGSRAMCVETQALTTRQAGPYQRLRAMGVANDRLFMISAVLARHGGGGRGGGGVAVTVASDADASDADADLPVPSARFGAWAGLRRNGPAVAARPRTPTQRLSQSDVLINVVGGLRLADPCADLAVAAAIASSLTGVPAPAGAVFIGELGLGGELRPAARLDERLKAAAQLGFALAYVPAASLASQRAPELDAGGRAQEREGERRAVARGLVHSRAVQRGEARRAQPHAAAPAAAPTPPLRVHGLRVVPVRRLSDALGPLFFFAPRPAGTRGAAPVSEPALDMFDGPGGSDAASGPEAAGRDTSEDSDSDWDWGRGGSEGGGGPVGGAAES